jgi:hypothetical protein
VYIIIIIMVIITLRAGMLIPVATLSKAWVCGSALDGVSGSNAAGGMDMCLL